MIQTLHAALSGQDGEALGKVLMACLCCGSPYPLSEPRCLAVLSAGGCDLEGENCEAPEVCGEPRPDLRTVLLGEIGEVNELCGTILVPEAAGPERVTGQSYALLPVTARCLLWRGEKVDWTSVFGGRPSSVREVNEGNRQVIGNACRNLPKPSGPSTITAVIMVGDTISHGCGPGCDCMEGEPPEFYEAARACAEAGVALIIPGDTERGVLRLEGT